MAFDLSEDLLVVLTGPVGGGKSTAALALAVHLRASDRPTAVIDLDLLYCMARQRDGFGDEGVWRIARQGAAVLANHFFESGAKVVVVEGGFLTQEECDDLREHVASGARVRLITLDVSFEQTLARVRSDPDPGRVMSRDPRALRILHERFVSALPFLSACSLVLDANSRSPEELAQAMAEAILADAGAR